MLKSAVSKVMWIGRATVFLMGLALMLALVFGMASTAFGANGGNFILGSLNNTATAITKLTGTVGGNPALRVSNPSTATGSTALDLQTASGKPPMKVNSGTKVTNLNADKLDGQDSNAFLGANAKAADSDKLDGKDISELSGTVVQMAPISGPTTDVGTFPDPFKFVSPTATVTTTSTQRLVGVVSAPLKTETTSVLLNYGLCYRAAGTSNLLTPFYGGSTAQAIVIPTTQTFTSAQTKVPGIAGTWQVGFCGSNGSDNTQSIKGDGNASGWIEVVN